MLMWLTLQEWKDSTRYEAELPKVGGEDGSSSGRIRGLRKDRGHESDTTPKNKKAPQGR